MKKRHFLLRVNINSVDQRLTMRSKLIANRALLSIVLLAVWFTAGHAETRQAAPDAAAQAVNQARLAQRSAQLAARKAQRAAEKADDGRNQALAGAEKFNVRTDNQGYYYAGGWRDKLPGNKGYHGFGVLSWPNGNRSLLNRNGV